MISEDLKKINKNIMKKGLLLEQLKIAKEKNDKWKIRQLEGKIACFDRKHYPKKANQ